MKTPSKVVSVRLPATLAKELKSYCKLNDCSVTDIMKKGFLGYGGPGLFEAPDPDANTLQFLSAIGGGSLIGILVYKGIYEKLREKKPDLSDEEITAYSVIGAISCAILSGWSISKVMKMFK